MKKSFRSHLDSVATDRRTHTGLLRLNKYISMTGIVSRRKADWLILEGSVRVNGKTIRELGVQVDPNKDTVVVNNKPIHPSAEKIYVMFNKPMKVVAAMSDPEGRPSIRDFMQKATKMRLFPVGRLDWDSEGLLLLTNDGGFAEKVSSTKSDVVKTYLVKLNGQPTDEQLQKLLRGISIIGGKTHALGVKRMPARGSDKYDWIKIIMNEASNRQVRLMFDKLGFDVKRLQRVAIGSLKLANLDRGHFKVLSEDDVKKVFLTPKELRENHRPTKKNP